MGRKSLGQIQGNDQLEQLPVSRIRTIMKSSPEVEGIRKEALFLVNKATEYFIQFLASTANTKLEGARELGYDYLSDVVQGDKRLTFMADLFPKRITYKEYKEIIAQRSEDDALKKAREAFLMRQQEEIAKMQSRMKSDCGPGSSNQDDNGKTDKKNCKKGSPSKPKGHNSPSTSSDSISTNSEIVQSVNSVTLREDQEGRKLGKLVNESHTLVVSECDEDDDDDNDVEEAMVTD